MPKLAYVHLTCKVGPKAKVGRYDERFDDLVARVGSSWYVGSLVRYLLVDCCHFFTKLSSLSWKVAQNEQRRGGKRSEQFKQTFFQINLNE